jgi:hypothetical protein
MRENAGVQEEVMSPLKKAMKKYMKNKKALQENSSTTICRSTVISRIIIVTSTV